MQRFLIISALLFLSYFSFWIYNFWNKAAASVLLMQGIVLIIIAAMIVFLWWLWKEAQY